MSKLSAEQVAVYLRKLPKWKYEGERLTKTFQFKDFKEAITFVNQIADFAETSNHHPDIDIRYNRVIVHLMTHDMHGVTGKDFLLAQQIESRH